MLTSFTTGTSTRCQPSGSRDVPAPRDAQKRDDGGGGPDMATVRVGLHNLELHLEYLTYLLQTRDWLGGGELSLADFTAAAHLSCLDYTGDVPWKLWPVVRDWYARIKSRPSFRPLLADHVAGMRPPPYYADLDF